MIAENARKLTKFLQAYEDLCREHGARLSGGGDNFMRVEIMAKKDTSTVIGEHMRELYSATFEY